jgi:hypothetical protein
MITAHSVIKLFYVHILGRLKNSSGYPAPHPVSWFNLLIMPLIYAFYKGTFFLTSTDALQYTLQDFVGCCAPFFSTHMYICRCRPIVHRTFLTYFSSDSSYLRECSCLSGWPDEFVIKSPKRFPNTFLLKYITFSAGKSGPNIMATLVVKKLPKENNHPIPGYMGENPPNLVCLLSIWLSLYIAFEETLNSLRWLRGTPIRRYSTCTY